MKTYCYKNKSICAENEDFQSKILFNYLSKLYCEENKILTTKELVNALSKTNQLNSIDLLLVNISDFEIDLSDKNNYNLIKPELIKCATKRILMFNTEMKEELVNKSDIIVEENRVTHAEKIDYEKFYQFSSYKEFSRTFTFLRDTLSNSKETGLIMLEAENNAKIPTLEIETVNLISHFVEDNLNLKNIINAKNIEQAQIALKSYTLPLKGKKH